VKLALARIVGVLIILAVVLWAALTVPTGYPNG